MRHLCAKFRRPVSVFRGVKGVFLFTFYSMFFFFRYTFHVNVVCIRIEQRYEGGGVLCERGESEFFNVIDSD